MTPSDPMSDEPTFMKCPRCGWVHAVLPLHDIVESVVANNRRAAATGARLQSLKRYLECFQCGTPTAQLVEAFPDDAPRGATIQAAVVARADDLYSRADVEPDESTLERGSASELGSAVLRVAGRLAIDGAILVETLAMDSPTGAKFLQGSSVLDQDQREWTQALYLLRLYRLLIAMVGSDAIAAGWLDSPNSAFGMQKPIEVMQAKDGLAWICSVLEAPVEQQEEGL